VPVDWREQLREDGGRVAEGLLDNSSVSYYDQHKDSLLVFYESFTLERIDKDGHFTPDRTTQKKLINVYRQTRQVPDPRHQIHFFPNIESWDKLYIRHKYTFIDTPN
jgi:hypothetical protein